MVWISYNSKGNKNTNYISSIYRSKTTYVLLKNTTFLILPNLLRCQGCKNDVLATESDASLDIVLMKFTSGLEDKEGWEVGAGGGLRSLAFKNCFLWE